MAKNALLECELVKARTEVDDLKGRVTVMEKDHEKEVMAISEEATFSQLLGISWHHCTSPSARHCATLANACHRRQPSRPENKGRAAKAQ
jgi:hypothetical protein